MNKIKVWEKPTISILGIEETQGKKPKPPGHDPQPNDVWCPRHNMYHGNNHTNGDYS